MVCSFELSLTNLTLFGLLYYAIKKAYEYYNDWRIQQMLERWNNTPKDKVILHGVPRGKDLPNISPYVLKLETYLRMANIPYEFETQDFRGPKQGKTPWITLNGEHVADSALIIQFLNKKFNKNLNIHLSPEQREISRAVRMMLENNFFWGFKSWRWVENFSAIDGVMKWPKMVRVFLLPIQSKRAKKALEVQGLGLHTFKERTEMTLADLRTVSIILGDKQFIAGDMPCEEDCAIFGMLAQAVWGSPGSPFEKLIEDDLQNLKKYCLRMKERFWPDWLACLDKTTDYY